MREAVQQQLQQRPAWQTLLVPAAGIGLLTLLFGPILFGLLTAGLAIGAAVTFSAASLFLIFPLIAGAFMIGGLGFGLSAGAFVLSGIVASVFNLALVGAGLAAGFALTNSLIKSALPGGPSNSDRASSGRQSSSATKRPEAEIDVEAEVRDAEEREAAAVAAEQLREFDALLAERERQRQIDQGMR
ncbi:g11863 [Coccomyxa elongata]